VGDDPLWIDEKPIAASTADPTEETDGASKITRCIALTLQSSVV
jgi:hypothetical protein